MLFTDKELTFFLGNSQLTFIVNVWKIWERSCANFSIIQLFSWGRTAKNPDKEANFAILSQKITPVYGHSFNNTAALNGWQ